MPDLRSFVPEDVERAFFRELQLQRIAFLIVDTFQWGDGEAREVRCELLFDAGEVRRVLAVARALDRRTKLRSGRLCFAGALRRLCHVTAEDYELFPVALEQLCAERVELEGGLHVGTVRRERLAWLALPRQERPVPRFDPPEPRVFEAGQSYIFAGLVSKSERTDAVLLDAAGEQFAVHGYRFEGKSPYFGDRVRVDEGGVVRVVRKGRRVPSVLARHAAPAASGVAGTAACVVSESEVDALVMARLLVAASAKPRPGSPERRG